MMMVFLFSTLNKESTVHATALLAVDEITELIDVLFLVSFDGRHRCRTIELLQKKDRLVYILASLRTHNATFVDGSSILLAQTIHLSKIASV